MVAQEAIDPLRIVCRIIGAPGADNYFGAAVESAKSWSKFPGRLIKRREVDARFSSLAAEEESLSRNETEESLLSPQSGRSMTCVIDVTISANERLTNSRYLGKIVMYEARSYLFGTLRRTTM